MESMPRSNRPRRPSRSARPNKWAAQPPEDEGPRHAPWGVPTLQSAPDGQWHVRKITPSRAGKQYTCPGCGRGISEGVEHLVAWRADHWSGDAEAAAGRRHWHTHCWQTRSYRY
jgi:hypothetical protein